MRILPRESGTSRLARDGLVRTEDLVDYGSSRVDIDSDLVEKRESEAPLAGRTAHSAWAVERGVLRVRQDGKQKILRAGLRSAQLRRLVHSRREDDINQHVRERPLDVTGTVTAADLVDERRMQHLGIEVELVAELVERQATIVG